MTQKTALETLIHLDSSRTYGVGINEFRIIKDNGESESFTSCSVTIFTPGAPKEAVVDQQFTTPDLSESMRRAVEFMKSKAA